MDLQIALPDEVDFYYKKLYPLQDQVLTLLSSRPELYLTGGTALARFYFQHRLSEDLDIFVKISSDDSLEVIEHQKRADRYAKDLANKLARQFKITNEFYTDTFAKFVVRQDDLAMKIDFVQEYNHIGELLPQSNGFQLDNLEDIGANKIAAFEDRCQLKDIIDLFYLSKQIPVARMLELADVKRVPLAYEHLLTINTMGISGSVLLLSDISSNELTEFIDQLRIAAEVEIKKKEAVATNNIDDLIWVSLWDFPHERRTINEYSIPVLRRRLKKLPLPERMALEKVLQQVA
jgi:hypothetical protein